MANTSYPILCDGCGYPASPVHIAERVARLELATRFRPVHMNLLFVVLAPLQNPADDFYGPPQSRDFFDSLMDALEIAAPSAKASTEADRSMNDAARLAEFQRRGFYMSYVSECPIPDESGNASTAIASLIPALVRRIQFNYKPKHIVLLGSNVKPLIETLEESGMGPLLLLQNRQPLAVPSPGDLSARTVFRAGLRTVVSIGAPA